MKKINLTLLYFIALFSSYNLSGQELWNKSLYTSTYHGGNILFYDILFTNDSGNLILYVDGYYHTTLIKLDIDKEIEWSINIPGNYSVIDVWPMGIVQGSDDSYYMLLRDRRIEDQEKYLIVKFKEKGNVLWQRKINTSYQIYSFKDIVIAHEGEADYIYVMGRWGTCGDPLVIKLDTLANIIWANKYTDGGSNIYITKTLSDNSVVFSSTEYHKLFIRRHNKTGEIIWSNLYGFPQSDLHAFPSQVIELKDLKQITLTNLSYSSTSESFVLLETDSLGRVVKCNEFSLSNICHANSIAKYNDSVLMVSGYYQTGNTTTEADMFVLFVDINTFDVLNCVSTFDPTYSGSANDELNYLEQFGNKIFSIGTGGGNSDLFFALIDSSSNGFCNMRLETMTNNSISVTTTQTNFAYEPINASLSLDKPLFTFQDLEWSEFVHCSVGINETKFNYDFIIYPNPVTTNLTIETAAATNHQEIKIFSAQGQQVMQTTLNSNHQTVNIEALSPGIYFLTLSNEEQTLSRKFVKQ